MKIWGRANSINVQKVLWTAEECGLAFERVDVGGPFGGNDEEWFLKLNPHGLVPCVEDKGQIFWESNSTVRYLASAYSPDILWPAEPVARSEADRWMDWELSALAPPMKICFWGLIRTPAEDRDPEAIARSAQHAGELFGKLDRWLSDRPFIAGDRFTMGDIPVGCMAWRYHALDVERPPLPNVAAWLARLDQRPGFRQHVAIGLS